MKTILFFSLMSSLTLFAGEGHGHKEKKEEHAEHKDEHKDEHGHGDEHGEGTSENGFKLNEKSTKKFGIQTVTLKAGVVEVPREAIFKGLNEVNVYRFRDGFYKRIDFKTLENNKDVLKISSSDLKSGDQIVIQGVGFLRIAEIAASGGISDSHSH
ncbi:hypothetical protein DOM21_09060 [Bacteriovorax stolpii]|uniref:Uncharacterized protein n=1 Tax=Bacteriovorax stolpii TaxID=960 RepID=A0A2K9NSF1_BACTC|nr:hypothetical protein [Bacteriovorax stolpii]AUN98422.1 hypothetical protein C0V70_09955 [Bacteriovorax stolpii]QDK41598.1 hypothetical protein DOM21_09060 [Bacteriovorax stolpii]TDP50955.1 hypothetical protein C8D79_3694 [Bacteriovorax stolpii]